MLTRVRVLRRLATFLQETIISSRIQCPASSWRCVMEMESNAPDLPLFCLLQRGLNRYRKLMFLPTPVRK